MNLKMLQASALLATVFICHFGYAKNTARPNSVEVRVSNFEVTVPSIWDKDAIKDNIPAGTLIYETKNKAFFGLGDDGTNATWIKLG